MTVLLLEEGRHVGNTNFHFEPAGYAIEGLHASTVVVLGVLVKINEAGGGNKVLGAEHTLAGERIGRDSRDLTLGDAEIACGV